MKNKYRHDSTTYFEFQTFETKSQITGTDSYKYYLKTKVTGRMLCSICHIHTKKGHDEKLNPQDSTGMQGY